MHTGNGFDGLYAILYFEIFWLHFQTVLMKNLYQNPQLGWRTDKNSKDSRRWGVSKCYRSVWFIFRKGTVWDWRTKTLRRFLRGNLHWNRGQIRGDRGNERLWQYRGTHDRKCLHQGTGLLGTVAKFNYRGLVSFSWIYFPRSGIYISRGLGFKFPRAPPSRNSCWHYWLCPNVIYTGQRAKATQSSLSHYLNITHALGLFFWIYFSPVVFFVGSPSFPEKCLSNHRNLPENLGTLQSVFVAMFTGTKRRRGGKFQSRQSLNRPFSN